MEPAGADRSADEVNPPGSSLLWILHRHRKLLAALGALWFGGAVAGGIVLSTVDARQGLHVFGPKTWIAGEPAVVRIGMRNLQHGFFEPIPPVEAVFVGPDGTARRPEPITDPAGDFVQGTLVAPRPAGAWTLRLTTANPDGQPVDAEVPVEVRPADATPPLPPTRKRTTKRPEESDGPLRLQLLPADGVMPGGLPSRLMVRATERSTGAPVSAEVALGFETGRSAFPLPSSVRTDLAGLAEMPVIPRERAFVARLTSPGSRSPGSMPPGSMAGTVSTARPTVRDTPTQFAVSTPSPVVAPGAAAPLLVRSLHRSGPVFVDAWWGDRWLATASVELEDGEATLDLPLPRPASDPALLWVQAYRSTYLPGDARGGLHLLVTGRTVGDAAGWLAGALGARGDEPGYTGAIQRMDSRPDPARIVRFLLGRLDRPDRDPPLLADSGITARQTVAALRARWQTRFVAALALGGAVMFGIMALLLSLNYRDVQARWHAVGGDEEGAMGTRRRFFLEASGMFAVLAIFILGIIQLLLTIRW